MRRIAFVLCFFLAFWILLFPVSMAEEENTETLSNWHIKIAVPEGATAVLQGNEYYIYAQEEGYIPYVMLRTYQYDDAVTFLDDFTAYMQEQYPDLQVTEDIARKTIGDKKCFEIDYSYLVSGYEVRDRRIAMAFDGTVYMFASKEIEELDMTVSGMLEDIVANCEFVSDDEADDNLGLAAGYLYCREDGMPKYWLDFSGIVTDDLVLHCYFRSENPVYSESCFVFDLSTAAVSDGVLKIQQVYDLNGRDYSDLLEELTLAFYRDAAVMTVKRNKDTLTEDGEDASVMDGVYVMTPVGVSADSTEKHSYLRPAQEGPYQPEELGLWAKIYYLRNTGIYPPMAKVQENTDGTFTIQLYDVAEPDSMENTESCASYTVDPYGEGKNDATEEQISLMR